MAALGTSGGGELLLAAGMEVLDEASEADELTEALGFLSAAAGTT